MTIILGFANLLLYNLDEAFLLPEENAYNRFEAGLSNILKKDKLC